jgi:hypothetical protein
MAPGGAEISILNSLGFSSIEEVHDLFRNPAILIPFAELCANCDVVNIDNIPPYLAVQYVIATNKPGLGLGFWPGRGSLTAIDKTDWTLTDHFADFVYKVGVSVFLGVVSWPCLSFEHGTDFLGPDCYQIALALSAVYRRNSVQRELQRRTGRCESNSKRTVYLY